MLLGRLTQDGQCTPGGGQSVHRFNAVRGARR